MWIYPHACIYSGSDDRVSRLNDDVIHTSRCARECACAPAAVEIDDVAALLIISASAVAPAALRRTGVALYVSASVSLSVFGVNWTAETELNRS